MYQLRGFLRFHLMKRILSRETNSKGLCDQGLSWAGGKKKITQPLYQELSDNLRVRFEDEIGITYNDPIWFEGGG